MSCASFIQIERRSSLPKPRKTQYDPIEDHAALIGLQALTLNLASANRGPETPKKKCLKPLRISTTRKTPEKHVSISPLSVTPRSAGSLSTPRFRASPCRSDSSGFQSLPSPASDSADKLFTNRSNVEVITSDSAESLSTRHSSGGSSGSSRSLRQTRPRLRQSTPLRQTTPLRQSTPQLRQSTPHLRQSTPQPRQNSRRETARSLSLDEHATVFDVQNVLRKGELVEGVLRFDRKSHQHAYISTPINLGRADGHLEWGTQ